MDSPFWDCSYPNDLFGNTSFIMINGLPLFVARDILSRYGVDRWDNYNGKTSQKIISGPYSIVSGVNKWYIGIYCRYNKQKHHLIITTPHKEWYEGCGLGQTIFIGKHLFVIINGLPLFLARSILSRYGLYRWHNYNRKTSCKIISVVYSIIFYPKFPQKIIWENTMAEHVRPLYFPMWYISGTISKKYYSIIIDLFNGK